MEGLSRCSLLGQHGPGEHMPDAKDWFLFLRSGSAAAATKEDSDDNCAEACGAQRWTEQSQVICAKALLSKTDEADNQSRHQNGHSEPQEEVTSRKTSTRLLRRPFSHNVTRLMIHPIRFFLLLEPFLIGSFSPKTVLCAVRFTLARDVRSSSIPSGK